MKRLLPPGGALVLVVVMSCLASASTHAGPDEAWTSITVGADDGLNYTPKPDVYFELPPAASQRR